METITNGIIAVTKIITFQLLLVFFILFVFSLIFKKGTFNDFETKTLQFVSYFLIAIGLLNFIIFLINNGFNEESFYGKYALTRWFMLISFCFSPLILLIEIFKNKIFPIVLVLFFMNIGRIFEIFAISITSLHRDY